MSLSRKVSRELISDENETARHECRIGYESIAKKAASSAPITQADQHCRQCQHLPDFDSDVEADDIGDQALRCQRKFLKLGCETEAMEQPEDQDSPLGVRLKSEESLEAIHVVEGLVNDR